MKRILVSSILALAVVAAGCGGSSSTSSSKPTQAQQSSSLARSASLVIRHQQVGCHSWALNGSSYGVSQVAKLAAGGTITVTNNDVMPHTLVQLGGPAARLASPRMAHMGATSTLSFPTAGTYRFTTKAGEDYMAGIETTGADNVLRLTVVVG